MEIGGGQGLTGPQVWSTTPRLLTIGGAALPSGSSLFPILGGTVSLTATGITTPFVQTGFTGQLILIGLNVNTALAGGVVTANVRISIDGSVQFIFAAYTGAITWDPGTQSIAQQVSGPGSAIGNILSFLIPSQFGNALSVGINVTATTLTTGALSFYVLAAFH